MEQTVTEAIEEHLRKSGRLDGLTPEAEEQAIEAAAGPVFVETREYSERVTGIAVFKKKILASLDGNATTWLPEVFVEKLSAALSALPPQDLEALRAKTKETIAEGQPSVQLGDLEVPARPEFVKLLDELLSSEASRAPQDEAKESDELALEGPLVLETIDNFDEQLWSESVRPVEEAEPQERNRRKTTPDPAAPLSEILTPIPDVQVEPRYSASSSGPSSIIGRTAITEGNLKNNHIYLRGFFEKFPSDAVGGSNRSALARASVNVRWVGSEWHETDLDGQKLFFLSRSMVRKFFEASGAEVGDIVEIEQTAPHYYLLRLQKRTRNLPTVSG